MAGPLQGPAAGSLDRTPYGTGRGAAAGGKIRSARHHQNFNQDRQVAKPGARREPYDRPVGRNPPQAAARRGAWIGSRIISGASSFLSSLFRRDGDESLALPQPPSPQEGLVNQDGESGDQIEDLLKDRVFTREQCDRFIKVLQSKLPIPNGVIGDRDQRYPDDELERERERGGERERHDRLSHRNMDHHEDNGSSPVDIAKAYMDKRLSPIPTSGFPMRTLDYDAIRTQEEYRATPSRAAPTPLSHIRIATPGHTPYVRLRPNNVRATPYPMERKRRVDDELENTGRRTKLKLTPANGPPVSLLPSASNGGFAGSYSDRMKNLQRKRLEKRSKEDSAALVPMQSSETARRILETLEILTPPKVKSLEDELAVVREKRPKELSPSMMSEQARKTEQTLECPLSDALQDPSPSHRATGEPSSSAAPVTISAEAAENDAKGKAVAMSPELSSRPWSTGSRLKGFRMNAAMEESNSDDEIATPAVSTATETKSTQVFGFPSSAADSKPTSPPLATLTVPAAESKSIFAFTSAPAAEKKASFEVQNIHGLFTTPPATSTATETKATQLFGSSPESKPAFAAAATSTMAATTKGKETPSTPAAESLFVAFQSAQSVPAPALTGASTSTPLFTAATETKSTQLFGSSSGPAFAFGAASTPVAETFVFSNAPVPEKKAAYEFLTPEIKSFTVPSAVSKAVETKSTPLFGSSSSATDSKPAFTPATTTPALSAPESNVTFAFSSAPVAEKKASFELLSSQTAETKPAFSFNATPPAATSAETKSAALFGSSSSAMDSKPVFPPVPAGESKPAFSFSSPPPAEKKVGFDFGGVTTSTAPFTFGSNANSGSSIFGIASSVPSPTAGTGSAMGTGDMEQDMAEEPVQASQPVVFGNTPAAPPAAQSFVFGSSPAALPAFGAASAPDFGAQQASAPAFGGFGSQPFGSSSPFGAAATPGSATTPAPAQPFVFGSSPPPPAFGAASAPSFGGTPQANAPSFGAYGSQPFGSQPSIFSPQQPGAGGAPAAPVFGSQPAAANPFSGFSGFTVGAGNTEGEQRTRKLFKAKRTGASKRGK